MPAQKTFRSIRVRGLARFEGGVVGIETGGSTSGVQLLATVTVDLNTTTAQDLYTVPSGKRLIITAAFISRPSPASFASGNGGPARIVRSSDGGAVCFQAAMDDWTDSPDAYATLAPIPTGALAIAAGEKAQFKMGIAFGSGQTAKIDLFGYLIDAV
jgi:hypothetical protein